LQRVVGSLQQSTLKEGSDNDGFKLDLTPPPYFVEHCDIEIRSNVPQDDAPVAEVRAAIDACLEQLQAALPSGYRVVSSHYQRPDQLDLR
jgi:hypothetical protein